MGMSLPVEGDLWCKTLMGDEGVPHGVSTLRDAARVKPGSDCRPVPPMTAMWMGSVRRERVAKSQVPRLLKMCVSLVWSGACLVQRLPVYVLATFDILRKPMCMYRTECVLGLKDLNFRARWSWMPFNIAIPPLNFLVGNLLIATLVQAPSSSSNADKEIDASLHELHSTESICSHIRRSCRRYALPSNNQRASIRMNYTRTCSDIGTSSNRCRNQYHPACLHADDPLHPVITHHPLIIQTQYLSGIACSTFQLPP
jgi:hypothetical protein